MPKNQYLPAIIFTVTNDLTYDQRMARICNSLSAAGYKVTIIGRKKMSSVSLVSSSYNQKRLFCFFERGKLFYLEYNLRLFLYLLFQKADAICAIDLDTILPCYYYSRLKKTKRILDSHEYFSQQKEIVSRPAIYKIWHRIEKSYLPHFPNGYTVSQSIADKFKELYKVGHSVIRNVPILTELKKSSSESGKRSILYQGAVNHARGLEFLIPAMKNIDANLHIYGDGNFMDDAKKMILANNLQEKVFIKGTLLPAQLHQVTATAYIGINLVEPVGLNQYFSLANKFFDFIQHELPQVTMNFPEYKKINDKFEIAVLIDTVEIELIQKAVNDLLTNEQLYNKLKANCAKARLEYNWQLEEKKLISFYKQIFE